MRGWSKWTSERANVQGARAKLALIHYFLMNSQFQKKITKKRKDVPQSWRCFINNNNGRKKKKLVKFSILFRLFLLSSWPLLSPSLLSWLIFNIYVSKIRTVNFSQTLFLPHHLLPPFLARSQWDERKKHNGDDDNTGKIKPHKFATLLHHIFINFFFFSRLFLSF